MYALVHPFLQIVLLHSGPQDLPRSQLLLALVLAAHAALGVVLFSFRLPLPQAVGAGLAGSALLAVMTVSLLAVNRLLPRAIQTLTALAGADVLLGVAALPITAWLHGSLEDGAASGLPGLLYLALLGWNLAVAGHVLRHSLDAPLPLGVVIALVFYVLSVSVLNGMFPGIA